MERNKNRTDLLAAGRKKLQQFRQKKDHKPSNSGTSGQLKSPKGSGKHEQVEITKIIPQGSSPVTETNESPVELNPVDSDAMTDDQMILPVTKLLVNLAEGDAGTTINQEHTPERSSSTMSGGMDMEESGDTLDPSSEDMSYQDPDASGAEVCNEIDGGNESTPSADVPVATGLGVMETNEANSLFLAQVEDGLKLDEEISTSESVGTGRISYNGNPICNQGTGTDQGVDQSSMTENFMEEPSFSSQDHVDVCGHPVDENQLSQASLLPSDVTLMSISPCVETRSSDQDASFREKEEPAELADENVTENSEVKATVEENARSFASTGGNEIARNYQEEYQFIQSAGETSTDSVSRIPERTGDIDTMENLKTHLYLTSVTKEFLLLQIRECDLNFHDEVTRLQGLVKEGKERNGDLKIELDQCKADLQAIHFSKKDLEIQWLSARGEVEELRNELGLSKKGYIDLTEELSEFRNVLGILRTENSKLSDQIIAEEEELRKLKAEKEISMVLIEELNDRIGLLTNETEDSRRESAKLSSQLADCRFLVLSLQAENSKLASQIISVSEGMSKIKAENECLANENMKIAASLSDQKDQLSVALQSIVKLEGEFKEAVANVEKLTEENLHLLNCLDIHQLKLKELVNVPHDQDSFAVKRPLIEAEEILLKLEKAVVGMHEYHISLGKVGDRVATSGVSKLIQAFESKTHSSDEVLPIEGHTPEDMYSLNLVKEEINNLRLVLKQVDLDPAAENFTSQKQHDDEIVTEIEVGSEATALENRETVDELIMKLAEFKAKIDNLQTQLNATSENVEETSGRLLNQVESLQNEVYGMGDSIQEVSTMTDVISLSAQKLRMCIGLGVQSSSDAVSDITASVDAATKMIEDLKDKLEASYVDRDKNLTSYEELSREYACLLEKDRAVGGILCRIYHKLLKYANNSSVIGDESEIEVDAEEVPQLPIEDFESFHAHLTNLFDEVKFDRAFRNKAKEELKEQCNNLTKTLEENNRTMDELRSLLAKTNQDFEDLNRGCIELSQKLENWEISASHVAINPKSNDYDSVNPLLARLRDLISSIIQEHEEAIQQLNVSKSYLFEIFPPVELLNSSQSEPLHSIIKKDIAPRISEWLEVEGRLNSLTSEILLKENEIQSLKDNLRKTEETLEISRSEVEQSEQRLSSVREKLGIAVSKGKGLVVQRDSLKQSLLEASSELEICKQELQAKEEKISVLEEKLKSSEADRIEALESELSYIRNSATQFRDYFLQKDSILQKIEETVEEMDLPEEFHSKDTVEKVEWLAKSVAGSSSLLTDWERNTASEESRSDLNRKYEEIQHKFYTLAEQNDMLEQSLRERNSLVERVEKAIDGIDMPHHLRSLEPEDRVEWLGRQLLEVEQERDSLSSKIERIDADLVSIGHENEVLSKNLSELRSQFSEILERSAQSEIEKDNLLREMSDLQEKLMEKSNEVGEIECEMKNLLDLVNEALPDQEEPSGVSSIDRSSKRLGRLIGKLLESYKTLALSYRDHNDRVPEVQSVEASQNDEVCRSLEVTREERDAAIEKCHFLTSEIEALARQRDELLEERERVVEEYQSLSSEFNSMAKERELLQKERDRAMDKYQSLHSEFESMTRQREQFQEERERALEKYQSLFSEVELTIKQRDLLQQLLNQEEQKSASTREKLNVAVRKGKALVQQRDSLKQTLEERQKDFEHIKKELDQQVGSLQLENKQLADALSDGSQTLNDLLNALHSIDVVDEISIVNPIKKIEWIHKRIASADDAAKSKRAAELLFNELNEVQERADILQEELEKTETGRNDALSHLERLSMKHKEEKRIYISSVKELKDGMLDLRKGFLGLSDALSFAVSKDAVVFKSMQSSITSVMKTLDGTQPGDLSLLAPISLLSIDALSEDGFLEEDISEDDDSGLIFEYLKLSGQSLRECTKVFAHLKEKLYEHSSAVDQYHKDLSQAILHFKTIIDDKEKEIKSLQKNIFLMFEACKRSAIELEKTESSLRLPDWFHREASEERETLLNKDFAREVTDFLLVVVKSLNDVLEAKEREMRREIEEKDTQIRDSEVARERFSLDLDSANELIHELQSRLEEMKNDQKYEQKIKSLMDSLSAKDQEIESLMQAIDEEESQMEELQGKNQELEQVILKNRIALESAESSRSKALTKLSKTFTRFEELHHLSENLLAEIENLQSQMQERDSEISFLRQEVARSTHDLLVKQEFSKKLGFDLEEVQTWMDTVVSRLGGTKINSESQNPSRVKSTIAHLDKQVEDLLLSGQTKDSLLDMEREKVNELSRKVQVLEASLQERESGQKPMAKSSDLLELEPMMNKRSTLGSVIPVARGGRRVNSEQASVAIDVGEDNLSLDEEDDDKAHGFKSLTMSKMVPRGVRPVADRIDGLWVAIERLLMRQPSLRLGLILYWVLLHAMLAASI